MDASIQSCTYSLVKADDLIPDSQHPCLVGIVPHALQIIFKRKVPGCMYQIPQCLYIMEKSLIIIYFFRVHKIAH